MEEVIRGARKDRLPPKLKSYTSEPDELRRRPKTARTFPSRVRTTREHRASGARAARERRARAPPGRHHPGARTGPSHGPLARGPLLPWLPDVLSDSHRERAQPRAVDTYGFGEFHTMRSQISEQLAMLAGTAEPQRQGQYLNLKG